MKFLFTSSQEIFKDVQLIMYRVAREHMFVGGQRPDVADILVVITDGMFDDPNATWFEAMNTRARNISIIGVSNQYISILLVSFLAAASASDSLSRPLLRLLSLQVCIMRPSLLIC